MLHTRSRNFILLAHPRTGTNFFCNIFSKRDDFQYLGEYHPKWKEDWYNIVQDLFEGDSDCLSKGLFWRMNQHESEKDGRGKFAKLFYYLFVQFLPNGDTSTRWDLLEYIKSKNIGVVHLRRRNVLDTALSLYLSEKDKNYFFKEYREAVTISVEEMEKHFWIVDWQTTAMTEALRVAKVRNLELWYEEMVADPQAMSDQASDFLHRPRLTVDHDKMTVRQRKGTQRDNILNYDELKEHFAGTKYGQHFQD